MRRSAIFFLLFFLSATAYSQEIIFDIHQIKLPDCIATEKKLGSESIPNKSHHHTDESIAQPVSFKRSEAVIPDLIVKYFYYKKDSALSKITYEWDMYNFDTTINNPQSAALQKSMVEKYLALEKEFTTKYGEGKPEGDLSDLSKAKTEGLHKINNWKPNDSTSIQMYADISNRYEDRGAYKIGTTHRIRLIIRNKSEKRDQPQSLDEESVEKLDKMCTSFFQALSAKDFSKTRSYFSEQVRDKVTDQQIKGLINYLSKKSTPEFFKCGIQLGLNGRIYIMLQYKYTDDTGPMPEELLRVVLDDKNKILGVQPIKMF